MNFSHKHIGPLKVKKEFIIKFAIITGVFIIAIIEISLFINLRFNFESNCHLILVNLLVALSGVLLFPVEFLLHEIGHAISLLLIYVLSGVKLMNSPVGLFSIECISLSNFKTINKIPLTKKWHIRLFACSGFIFIILICIFLSYLFKFYLISAIWLAFELYNLVIPSDTNDMHYLLYPETFRYNQKHKHLSKCIRRGCNCRLTHKCRYKGKCNCKFRNNYKYKNK